MNYRERREIFVTKCGGAKKIQQIPGGVVYYEIEDGTEELVRVKGGHSGLLPLCICGNKSHTLYGISVEGSENIHYLGTTCINKYGKTGIFGGKNGIKQGSWMQLGESLAHLAKGMRDKDSEGYKVTMMVIQRIEKEDWYYTIEEKEIIEKSIGFNIRFKPIEPILDYPEKKQHPRYKKETPEEEAKRKALWGIQ